MIIKIYYTPLEESVSFKGAMERGHILTLGALSTAGASTSTARTIRVWSSKVKSTLGFTPQEFSVSLRLKGLGLSVEFIAEVVVDLDRLISRSMVHSVRARWMLWLKHCSVGSASMQGLCAIPFLGGNTLGRLEDAIFWVTESKIGPSYPRSDALLLCR